MPNQPTDTKEVIIDPKAQEALNLLIESNLRKKARLKRIKFALLLIILPFLLPLPFSFYCSNIIGTNFEEIIIRKYPDFTHKIVRATVILDRFYLDTLGPLAKLARTEEDIKLRKEVIALALEKTREGEKDLDQILLLRNSVGSHLLKLPNPHGKGVAFAVYELPLKKPERSNSEQP